MKQIILVNVFFCFLSGAINAESSNVKKLKVLPFIMSSKLVNPAGYETFIDILAVSGPQYILLEGFDNNGQPSTAGCYGLGGPVTSIYLNFEENWEGYSRHPVCGAMDGVLDNSWILIEQPGADYSIQYSAKIFLRAGREVLHVASIPAVIPETGFLVRMKNGLSSITSYAIVNPSMTETATVVLHAGRREPDDDPPECKTTLTIPPLNRVSKFITELVPGCEHGSTMRITSDIPIAVATLEVFLPEYKFVSLPVEVLEDSE